MSITGPLPPNITEKMASEDRKKLGRRAWTLADSLAKRQRKVERQIHDDFISFLRRHSLPYWHSDPSRKSTGPLGYPDFLVGPRDNRGFFVEFKVPPNGLSREQSRYIEELRANRNFVLVAEELTEGAAYTAAIQATIEFFNL